jgi:hypothetical protein
MNQFETDILIEFMSDLIFVVVLALFFALSCAYACLCEKM